MINVRTVVKHTLSEILNTRKEQGNKAFCYFINSKNSELAYSHWFFFYISLLSLNHRLQTKKLKN